MPSGQKPVAPSFSHVNYCVLCTSAILLHTKCSLSVLRLGVLLVIGTTKQADDCAPAWSTLEPFWIIVKELSFTLLDIAGEFTSANLKRVRMRAKLAGKKFDSPSSYPEAALLLVSTKNRYLWPRPTRFWLRMALCKHNRLRPESIRFVKLDWEHAQSDGKWTSGV